MNNGMISKNVDLAYNILKDQVAINGKIDKGYLGQVDGFSSTIMNSGLVSAIAFFSRKQNKELNNNVNEQVNRKHVLKVIANILDQDPSVEFTIGQKDEILSLFNYANINDKIKQKEIMNQIMDAVVAVKFAIKLFPLISSDDLEEVSTSEKKKDETDCEFDEKEDYAVKLHEKFIVKKLQSNNMNYKYNVEYFKPIKSLENPEDFKDIDGEKNQLTIEELNKTITQFSFNTNNSFDEIQDLSSFELITEYPGLLVGIGYDHDLALDGAYKCGFSFDYVTGNPYIPGSELKGLLRNYFPKDEDDVCKISIINECLEKADMNLTYEEISVLNENIFENNDIFIGAYPVINEKEENILLDEEYITPHKDDFLNPNPISLIKVRPNVTFKFNFILHDLNDEHLAISKTEKLRLFKNIILNFGIGAKTNVGFSYFQDDKQ